MSGARLTTLVNRYGDYEVLAQLSSGGMGEVLLARKRAAGGFEKLAAIKTIRSANPEPSNQFPGKKPTAGSIDPSIVNDSLGSNAKPNNGVVKVAFPREGKMHGITVGGTMGLSSWAAFSGNDDWAAMDGDFIMTGNEVQPVLRAMRKAGIHVVALHNHMTNEEPHFYFTHFWATGSVKKRRIHASTQVDRDVDVR